MKWAKPFACLLSNPFIWQFRRRGIARGVALGLFAAFAMPIAQTPFAALFAATLRANLPVAAAATLVTNPVTVPFLYPLAYFLGSGLLPGGREMPDWAGDMGFWQKAVDGLLNFAGPTYLGLLIFALGSAAAGYFAVLFGWSVRIRQKRNSRQASVVAGR